VVHFPYLLTTVTPQLRYAWILMTYITNISTDKSMIIAAEVFSSSGSSRLPLSYSDLWIYNHSTHFNLFRSAYFQTSNAGQVVAEY